MGSSLTIYLAAQPKKSWPLSWRKGQPTITMKGYPPFYRHIHPIKFCTS